MCSYSCLVVLWMFSDAPSDSFPFFGRSPKTQSSPGGLAPPLSPPNGWITVPGHSGNKPKLHTSTIGTPRSTHMGECDFYGWLKGNSTVPGEFGGNVCLP